MLLIMSVHAYTCGRQVLGVYFSETGCLMDSSLNWLCENRQIECWFSIC